MNKNTLCILLIITSTINCMAQKSEILDYSDGSNNHYKITNDNIHYYPVKKEMSSSGFYDGGVEKNKSITTAEFNKVLAKFEEIFKNKNIHTEKRIMTSGLLTISRGKDIKQRVIVQQGEKQKELETLLKSLLED